MKRRTEKWLCITALLSLVLFTHAISVRAAHHGGSGTQTQLRSLTIDDVFNLRSISDATIAPAGDLIAFVILRPLSSLPSGGPGYVFDLYGARGRGELWVAPAHGEKPPTRIAYDKTDNDAYWMPQWSPDGTRLAVLSTRGGADNIYLWVWDRRTGHLTQVTKRAVAPIFPLRDGLPFVWVDNQRLAAVFAPTGDRNPPRVSAESVVAATAREWGKMRQGLETTASVLDSGFSVRAGEIHQEVVSVSVSGEERVLAKASAFQELKVAPDRRHVAFLEHSKRQLLAPPTPLYYDEGGFLRFDPWDEFRVYVADASGRVFAVLDDRVGSVVPHTLQWSPDGHTLAFIATVPGRDGVYQIIRCNAQSIVSVSTLGGEVAPLSLVWVEEDQLLVLAEQPGRGQKARRRDWWLLSKTGATHKVSERLSVVPETLIPMSDGRAAFGIGAGALWRFDVMTASWTNPSNALNSRAVDIAWPKFHRLMSAERVAIENRLIVQVGDGNETEYYRVNALSGAETPLERPSEQATLSDYNSNADVSVFAANESSGTYVTSLHGSTARRIVETNEFMRYVDQGDVRQIAYRSLDGQNLTALLLLPAQHVAGVRYPLVTSVYPGTSIKPGSSMPALRANNDFSFYNLQLLAARGYAVLVPSIPLSPRPDIGHEASDPYMELLNGVMPAIDKVVELGMIDSNRIAVIGHSFGGFATYALVTQTTRFRAAIVSAGVCDLISLYGSFVPTRRYERDVYEYPKPGSIETGIFRTGAPPWKDIGRYLRNSPLFHVQRVQTPLLILHGEMDVFPITQAEEFFTALRREGKRVRFVRYWAEGHVLRSAANIRDRWNQVFMWLEEFLGAPFPSNGNRTR